MSAEHTVINAQDEKDAAAKNLEAILLQSSQETNIFPKIFHNNGLRGWRRNIC